MLKSGDLLVFNDTKVIPARLFGLKPTGGKVELLIERVLEGNQVAAHMRVSKKPDIGTSLAMSMADGFDDDFRATLLGRWPDEKGTLFRFVLSNNSGDHPDILIQRHGHVPLPPYIVRDQSREEPEEAQVDAMRYQTVFAKSPGATAAPTAALHFDDPLLASLTSMGISQAFVTLHVGAGTFQPVKTEDLTQHQMHSEWYQIPPATLEAIQACKARGGRVVAVGTTTVRTLESWATTQFTCGETTIFITPGFDFQIVDLLITNFHLPKSTLMMLISAFAGHAHVMSIYRHAISQSYRFYSFGDAMLLSKDHRDAKLS